MNRMEGMRFTRKRQNTSISNCRGSWVLVKAVGVGESRG